MASSGPVSSYGSRPSAESIKARWHTILSNPILSQDLLRQDCLNGLNNDGAILRSLYWRVCLNALPAVTALGSWPLALTTSRAGWNSLKERYLRNPDGKQVESGAARSQGFTQPVSHNPLSIEDGNPWQVWFTDLDMRAEISKDVMRTYPEYAYFTLAYVREMMTNILHVWTKLNPDIGYRQGIHELLAPMIWMIDYDSLETATPHQDLTQQTLSREHIEADAWVVFSKLMLYAKSYYDSSPSIPLQMRNSPKLPIVRSNWPDPSTQSFKVVQPIINHCYRIQDNCLTRVAPSIANKLALLDIEPQLYGMRWLRMLFSRELPMQETLILWDALFAEDPTLKIVDWVCVALLLRIGNEILESTYAEALQVLLKYPRPPDGNYHIKMMFKQAVMLRDDPSPSTAETIVQQNIQAGLATASPLPSPIVTSTSRLDVHRRSESAVPANLARRPALFEVAKGAYERAEALGINRALTGTIEEIKRNVNHYSAATGAPLIRQKSAEDPFPGGAASLATRSAQTSEQQRLQRELTTYKSRSSECASALEKVIKQLERSARERVVPDALAVLKNVHDVLASRSSNIDPDLLQALILSSPPTSQTNGTPLPTSQQSPVIDPLTGFPSYLTSTSRPIASLPRVSMASRPETQAASEWTNKFPLDPAPIDRSGFSVPPMTSQFRSLSVQKSAQNPLE